MKNETPDFKEMAKDVEKIIKPYSKHLDDLLLGSLYSAIKDFGSLSYQKGREDEALYQKNKQEINALRKLSKGESR